MSKWMAIYNDFVAGYESGMTMVEIDTPSGSRGICVLYKKPECRCI